MIVYDVGGDWVPLWAVRHKFFDKKKSISKIIIEFCWNQSSYCSLCNTLKEGFNNKENIDLMNFW